MSSENQNFSDQIQDPPQTLTGILRQLGPGLIVAGSIVGSGELIATTSTGAQAGFWLLWLIIIGCIIKVFVQVELGRYAIVSCKGTMLALDEVPGPRIQNRGNWILWYWFIMFIASIAQLGGIVGGVGQALSISAPITGYGRAYNEYAEAETQLIVDHAQLVLLEQQADGADDATLLARSIGQVDLQRVQLLHALQQLRVDAIPQSPALQTVTLASEQMANAYAAVDPDGADGPVTAEQLDRLTVELYRVAKLREEAAVLQGRIKKPVRRDRMYIDILRAQAERLEQQIAQRESQLNEQAQSIPHGDYVASYLAARDLGKPSPPVDDKLWATVVALVTAVLLVVGRFGFIQSFATAMVALFTLITIVNLVMLQSHAIWSVSLSDIVDGLRFRLPPGDSNDAVRTALATFGIIGVGATELIVYPYWCLEKGYGRYTGPRDESPAWADRAQGWMRVMRWDAWCSMVIYTFATVAFYLLGASILGRTNLDPGGREMIRYLSVMYKPVFGATAQSMFLFGAFAVLYSTFFVANASHARTFSDALRAVGLAPSSEQAYRRRVRILSAVFPCLCLIVFVLFPSPKKLVLLSGIMQAIMLPMIAGAALYFRYRKGDPRLLPGRLWDTFLWLSAAGMFVVGAWAAWSKVEEIMFTWL